MSSCSIDECEVKSVCKGYCDVHYQRLKRRGTIHIPSQYEKFLVIYQVKNNITWKHLIEDKK